MFYAVNYEEGFGITTDISKVLFMVEKQLSISCRTFMDMKQAYCYACKTYIQTHARYGQNRPFPMPKLEAFIETDMFESPAKLPFAWTPENRIFAVVAYMGAQGYNAIFANIGELAGFCKANMLLNVQEFPNVFLAQQWLWTQQMIPIMAIGAYVSAPIYMPIPGSGEAVPFTPSDYLPEVNVLEAAFPKQNGVELFDNRRDIYEKY